MSATVLATGGAGYIGSHVVAELLASGRRVVMLDDFSNSAPGHRRADRRAGAGRGRGRRGRYPRCGGARRDLRAVRHRCGDPPGRAEGGRRVGGGAAALLRRERRRGGGAVAGDAAARGRAAGLLVIGDGLRHAGGEPDRRGGAAGGAEPVRAHEADDRADPRGCRRGGAGVRGGFAALLQPGRRAQVGAARREPERGSEQPVSLHRPDRRRDSRAGAGVRQRLSDAGRHRGAGLCPRGRPGARASGGGGFPAGGAGGAGAARPDQPRLRPGVQRARVAARPSGGRRGGQFPTRWSAGGRATWRNAWPIPAARRRCWGGGQGSGWTRCAPTTGRSSVGGWRVPAIRRRQAPARPGPRARRRRQPRRRAR